MSLSNEPKPCERVGNNHEHDQFKLRTGEQRKKTLGDNGKGKNICVKQGASTDNCGNKGTQAKK